MLTIIVNHTHDEQMYGMIRYEHTGDRGSNDRSDAIFSFLMVSLNESDMPISFGPICGIHINERFIILIEI
jgi:hypothetical protein